MSYYVNPDIKNTFRIFPEQGRYDYLRLDMNENPEGLPEDFVKSVLNEITPEFLSIYPEPDAFTEKYSQFIGMPFENILATNGSDMAIRYVLETFGEKGKNVVTVSPSFEMYWVNCSILGLKHKPVMYNPDLSLDVDSIVEAIDDDTCVVVLLNPNNPMGNVYTEEEVRRIAEKARDNNAVLIIDEAYHYFYDVTFIHLVEEYDNILILRTFSKLFSLAACRLGVIISNPVLINYVRNGKLTFDVNSIALLFGERILEHKEIVNDLIATEKAGKAYILEDLKTHGYECKDCMGNYIFIKPRKNPKEITRLLKDKKRILIHSYGNELLKDYIRVSVGSASIMKQFLDAFYELDCVE